jgi:di/tricarboxylate transporter
MLSRADPALIALVGAITLAVAEALMGNGEAFAGPLARLGSDSTVFVLSALIMAAGLARSGLIHILAERCVGGGSGRSRYWRLGLAIFMTTFLVPATTARGAMLMPIVDRCRERAETRGEQRAISLMAPLVVVLGALASPIAAAANILAMQVLAAQTSTHVSFLGWIVMCTPLAMLVSAGAMTIARVMFLADDRAPQPTGPVDDAPAAERSTDAQVAARVRMFLVLAGTVALWSTSAWHHLEPAFVALLGATITMLPRVGLMSIKEGMRDVDWSLIVLLAAAGQIGVTIAGNGIVKDVIDDAAAFAVTVDAGPVPWTLALLTALAMLVHVIVNSRTARVALMLPVALPFADLLAIDPMTMALSMTAGAGFCVLTPAGSKALMIFAQPGRPDFERASLFKAGLCLLPLQLVLTLAFAAAYWPIFLD